MSPPSPTRSSPPAILLRESYRQNGKVPGGLTLANLSDWPAAHIEGLRGVLKGGTVIPAERDAFTVIRSLPHGHVAAALGTARKIGLDRILGPDGDRCRDLVLAMLVGRILEPAAKLAAARALSPATATSSLGEVLGLGDVDEDELYAALDWLLQRQPAIETALAKRHLSHGTLVLYDVSSSYMEGRCCPLARRGYEPRPQAGQAADHLRPALCPRRLPGRHRRDQFADRAVQFGQREENAGCAFGRVLAFLVQLVEHNAADLFRIDDCRSTRLRSAPPGDPAAVRACVGSGVGNKKTYRLSYCYSC